MSEDQDDQKQTGNRCPKCNGPAEIGFGLAGGGYGAYLWCDRCEQVVEKWQENQR